VPFADERGIGTKFNSSIRKANAMARSIEALLAAELGEGTV
jgi:alpha-D-ribose 1-methylphosphonate 5-triphosphate synthase subunit PhnI